MHFTGIHTDFLGAKVGACITSAYGKSDSKWPLKSVWTPFVSEWDNFVPKW